MNSFRIAAVQMNALKGELEHNLELHRRFTQKAARAGCQLVVFPELSATAHFGDPAATRFAEEAGAGPAGACMQELAAAANIVISYGFCEKACGTYYNAQALVGPRGLIGVQRKVHASRDEYFYFRMGRSLEVFDLGFCKVGTLICYDSLFFEAWRTLVLKGAEVILLPHAARSAPGKKLSAERQKKVLRHTLRNSLQHNAVYAADNHAFAVFANQWGYNGHSTHSGGAFVVAPDGQALAKSGARLQDLSIHARLDARTLDAVRNVGSVLKFRRPELYGEVARML